MTTRQLPIKFDSCVVIYSDKNKVNGYILAIRNGATGWTANSKTSIINGYADPKHALSHHAVVATIQQSTDSLSALVLFHMVSEFMSNHLVIYNVR